MRRELEGERPAVAGDEVARLAERRRLLLLAPEAPAHEPDLEHQELLEGQALTARFGGVGIARPVEGGERVDAERELGSDTGRDRIGMVVRVRQRLRHELAQLFDGDVLARRVDGREVRGGRGAVHVVRADGELVPAQLAAQAHARPGLELVGEPDLVEPDRGDLAALVGDARLDDREPAPGAAHRGADDRAADRDLVLGGEEVGDPHLRRGRLVAERSVIEQVADRAEP